MDTNIIGQKTENEAFALLTQNGYIILDRNFRCKEGEIDLIAKKGDCLIFVEVKTLNTYENEEIEHIMGKVKQAKIKKTIEWYLAKNELSAETKIRVDLMVKDKKGQILHFKNAF